MAKDVTHWLWNCNLTGLTDMRPNRIIISTLVIICLTAGQAAGQHFKLPSLFSDGMCLRQNDLVDFWGWDSVGQVITVAPSWTNETYSTSTPENGKWHLPVETPGAGGPYTVKINGSSEQHINDVVIGEVWLCSGQSNMGKPLGLQARQKPVINFHETSLQADHPEIRLFKVASRIALNPKDDCQGEWVRCDPNEVLSFSAVGYFFGLRIYEELECPVGLIQSTWGGTPVEAWTADADINDQALLARFSEYSKRYPEDSAHYYGALEDFDAGLLFTQPKKPESVYYHDQPQKGIAVLFNGMIAPLVPYCLSGIIWYQGEANIDNPEDYAMRFPNLIESWRRRWKQEQLPFYFVQIAPFNYSHPHGVARIVEAQKEALDLGNTGIAATSDISTYYDIHPPEKEEVGRRLSLLALKNTYGMDSLVCSGPVPEDIIREPGSIRLIFVTGGGGVVPYR